MNLDLEIHQTSVEFEEELAEFFCVLADADEDDVFLPHPLTHEQAGIVAKYQGKDFYAFATYRGKVIGYCFLRGWDEGYEIPSLGISVHPDFRGAGVGNTLMHYLHAVALLRGCSKIRLRVRTHNHRARQLYEKLGYIFEDSGQDFLVGFVNLKTIHPTSNIEDCS